MTDERAVARALWAVTEPLHSYAYFSPEHAAAMKQLGLRGYWMGYFASRSAPLGAAPAPVVGAVFYVFRQSMVARALPDAWKYATPEQVLAGRLRAAEAGLAGMPEAELAGLADLLVPLAQAADCTGRPLAAGNQALPVPDSAAGRLWWATTVLREHRGDGHLASLVTHGIGRLECLVLAAAGGADAEVLRVNRGWPEEEWAAGVAALTDRGLIADGTLTAAGRELVAAVEADTDAAALGLWPSTGTEEIYDRAYALSSRLVGTVVPLANPVGVFWPPPPLTR
jgi:hypothetical protein